MDLIERISGFVTSHRKPTISVSAYFGTAPKTLKTIEISIHNKSSRDVVIDELDLMWRFSTVNGPCGGVFPLLAEPLQVIGNDQKMHPIKYPLHVRSGEVKQFTLTCNDGASDVGASIAAWLNEVAKMCMRIRLKDDTGHLSYGKWTRIKSF